MLPSRRLGRPAAADDFRLNFSPDFCATEDLPSRDPRRYLFPDNFPKKF